jgi:hypothetical protein
VALYHLSYSQHSVSTKRLVERMPPTAPKQ